MKLSITVTDQRRKVKQYGYEKDETEEYSRVNVTDLDAEAPVVAGLLRTLADQLDPPETVSASTFQPTGTWTR